MFTRNIFLRTLSIALVAACASIHPLAEDITGIEGKVVDKVEHAPIGNTYVLVHRNGGTDKSVRTDGSGRYVIELPPNIYDVFISASGFAPVSRKIDVARTGMVVFDAVLDVSDVGMTDSSPQGVVGDIPGGLPPDGAGAVGGILSSVPQSPDNATGQRVRVAEKVMRVFLITKVDPTYPSEAERQHVDGAVLLRINIDESGNVVRVDLVSGHPLLATAAIDAVKRWKYKPYLLNHKPVEVETTALIKFVFSGGKAFSVIAFASPIPRRWR